MDIETVIGLVAGGMTSASLLPQLHRIWKTKRAKDVSLGMFLVMCTGIILWLVYGFLKHDTAIIVTNAVSLILALCILVLKLKFGRD